MTWERGCLGGDKALVEQSLMMLCAQKLRMSYDVHLVLGLLWISNMGMGFDNLRFSIQDSWWRIEWFEQKVCLKI